MLKNRHIANADGTFELANELREGFRSCESFFRVLRASQAAIPQFIGLPSSKVIAITHARGGNYHITPPASMTLASRARRVVSEQAVSALTSELQREVTRLAQAYDRLWAASRSLGREPGRDDD